MRSAWIQNLFAWSVLTCAFAPGCGGVEGAQDGIPDDRQRREGSLVPTGQEAPDIEFTERATIALPQDRLLGGAALSPSGDLVVAWFAGTPGVRVYRGSASRDILAAEVGHAIGVQFLNEKDLEIVDAASGDVVTADTTGVALSRHSLPGSRQAAAAARTPTGWIVAIPGSDTTPPHLWLPDGSGMWAPDSTYARTLGLAADGREALVWQGFSPLRVWRIGQATDWVPAELERVNPDWFADDVAQSLRLDPGIWSSTSVVGVGPEYVQTLAHRGTDERLLLRFDSHGRFLRYTRVEAPFGFIASAGEAPAVLAIRTFNASELVKYSWESVPDPTRKEGAKR
ncbi:MAG: hypothetical protein OXJ54_11840 [Gemmatimonadetes bacterium]|nr:hypothetical protein [Candidatus Palauibacter rhopaloidicola]